MLLCASKFATAKIECISVSSKWASKLLWGTIYFAVDGTSHRPLK